MRLIATAFALSMIASASVAQDRLRGGWPTQGWAVEWYETSDGGYCKASSPVQTVGNEWHQVAFRVGDGSGVELYSTAPVPQSKSAALVFPDGAGYDFYSLRYVRSGTRYVVANDLSGSMVAKVLSDLRAGVPFVRFTIATGTYTFSTAQFADVYASLLRCERRRAGLLLDE